MLTFGQLKLLTFDQLVDLFMTRTTSTPGFELGHFEYFTVSTRITHIPYSSTHDRRYEVQIHRFHTDYFVVDVYSEIDPPVDFQNTFGPGERHGRFCRFKVDRFLPSNPIDNCRLVLIIHLVASYAVEAENLTRTNGLPEVRALDA